MAITGAQLVQDALYQCGVLGQDQGAAASNDDAQLVLRRLQRMLDSWSTDNLMIFQSNAESLPMSANVSTYSTSALSNGRPVKIQTMWVSYGGVDYPIEQIDDAKYASIAIKTIAAIPRYCWINDSFPQMNLTFFPVPFAPMTLNLIAQRVLQPTAVTMSTTLTFPPGYEKALVDCLAVDVAPSFGVPVTADMRQSEKEAKTTLQRLNLEPLEMSTDFDTDDTMALAMIYKPW